MFFLVRRGTGLQSLNKKFSTQNPFKSTVRGFFVVNFFFYPYNDNKYLKDLSIVPLSSVHVDT